MSHFSLDTMIHQEVLENSAWGISGWMRKVSQLSDQEIQPLFANEW